MLLMIGCGSTTQKSPDLFDFISVGVDPHEEAAIVFSGLKTAGYTVGVWHHADAYAAFDALREDASVVRVVTRRGVAMGIDAPDARVPDRIAVELLQSPTGDLDDDGHDELVVALHRRKGLTPCLALVRISDEGIVREVALPLEEFGEGACVQAFVDVVAGPASEALVSVPVPEAGVPAVVRIPLRGKGGRWTKVPDAMLSAHLERERERTAAEIDRAREAAATDAVYQLAVELAALVRFSGEDRDRQVEAFDKALKGLELSPMQAERIASYRQHLLYSGAVIEPGQGTMLSPGSDGPKEKGR